MVMPPFAASAGWYSRWLAARLEGAGDTEAIRMACGYPDFNPKSLRRTRVSDGANISLLSVPVAKGPGMILSGHGNWPHVHLGTINAIYGRSPYFPHLFDSLTSIYHNTPETLPELNRGIHDLVSKWIDTEAAAMAASDFEEDPNSVLLDYCADLETKVNYSVSILDAIFRFGKDTLFVLLNGWIKIRNNK